MKILQIANDFAGSRVHRDLFQQLDSKGVEQVVYCPVRDSKQIGGNSFEGRRTHIVYSDIIKPYHKYVYHVKRWALYKDMVATVDVRDVDIVHAATLFSDGGLAYKLYKQYGIPYVVAVRNTDINGFLNMLPNTWLDGIQILIHAKRIFFISEGLMRKFEQHFIIRTILNRIKEKFVLLPNGIDDYFLDHIYQERRTDKKVIYVGDFSNNKNVVRLGEAILRLRNETGFENTTLTLVGGGKNETDAVIQLIESHSDAFRYLGKIYEKDSLCEVFRRHSVFAMPSIHETFGLVYLEALSQNLPVLYTKNQGIDGLLHDSVGIGVNPLSINEITAALRRLLSDKTYFSNAHVDFSQFRWSYIADKYMEHYKDCLGMPNVDRTLLDSFKI
ncbi:MAG: glycosyltransferase family 4 protein [Bacteroidaceae bacterium]|nr:glycosyltransferase family 4 protein [Bacteroidaceae bacterium]